MDKIKDLSYDESEVDKRYAEFKVDIDFYKQNELELRDYGNT